MKTLLTTTITAAYLVISGSGAWAMESQAGPDDAAPYMRASDAMPAYQADKNCDGAAYQTILSALAEMKAQVKAAKDPHDSWTINLLIQQYLIFQDFTDAMKAKKCPDQAEMVHKDILEQYATRVYRPFFDKANAGLADVRKMRDAAK